MKVPYSQVLLIVSTLALALSLGIYVRGRMERPQRTPILGETVALAGGPYQPILAEEPGAVTTHWAAPSPQDAGGNWKFGLFTPPKIWFNHDTREWTAQPLTRDNAPDVVPFVLERIEQVPYRLRFKGYSSDPTAPKLLIEDATTGQTVLSAIGDRVTEMGFTILSFDERLRLQPDGTKVRAAAVTIRDLRTGEEFVITQGEPRATDAFLVTLQATEETARRFKLTSVEEAFDYKGITYTLKTVDRLAGSVALEACPTKAPETVSTYVLQQMP